MIDEFAGDRVLIGETNAQRMNQIVSMYGRHHDELQLPMNFNLFWSNFSAASYNRELAAWESQKGGWPLLFFSNHDFPRSYTRLGDGLHDAAIARVMAVMLLTARGTPIIYYGEELGMANGDPDLIRSARENSGNFRQPPFDARDAMRTPMQWDASANAGFTRGTPWLPVESTAESVNVAEESRDADSLLQLYRRLIRIRKANRALTLGSYIPLNVSEENGGSSAVFSYMRRDARSKEALVITMNFSASSHTVEIMHEKKLLDASQLEVILEEGAMAAEEEPSGSLRLGPYGFLLAKIRR
jgi:alpha-glucosidase